MSSKFKKKHRYEFCIFYRKNWKWVGSRVGSGSGTGPGSVIPEADPWIRIRYPRSI